MLIKEKNSFIIKCNHSKEHLVSRERKNPETPIIPGSWKALSTSLMAWRPKLLCITVYNCGESRVELQDGWGPPDSGTGHCALPQRGSRLLCTHVWARAGVCFLPSALPVFLLIPVRFQFDLVSAFSSRAISLRDASFVTRALEFHTLKSTQRGSKWAVTLCSGEDGPAPQATPLTEMGNELSLLHCYLLDSEQ